MMECKGLDSENFCAARNARIGNPDMVCVFCPAIDKKVDYETLKTVSRSSINPNQCRFMIKGCGCGKAVKDFVHKVRCTHPEVPEEFKLSRTSEKCSIPFDSPPEKGMQFCKFYQPYRQV